MTHFLARKSGLIRVMEIDCLLGNPYAYLPISAEPSKAGHHPMSLSSEPMRELTDERMIALCNLPYRR